MGVGGVSSGTWQWWGAGPRALLAPVLPVFWAPSSMRLQLLPLLCAQLTPAWEVPA